MSGSNVQQGGAGSGGYSNFNQDNNSYQRSHSIGGNMGNQTEGASADNDWDWLQDHNKSKTSMPHSNSYQDQLRSNVQNQDDDWTGFDTSGYQSCSTSYQNSNTLISGSGTAANVEARKNLKLQNTKQKLAEGFDDLDVKNVKPKTTAVNSKKTAEDDAWNLLMN